MFDERIIFINRYLRLTIIFPYSRLSIISLRGQQADRYIQQAEENKNKKTKTINCTETINTKNQTNYWLVFARKSSEHIHQRQCHGEVRSLRQSPNRSVNETERHSRSSVEHVPMLNFETIQRGDGSSSLAVCPYSIVNRYNRIRQTMHLKEEKALKIRMNRSS